MGRNSLMTESKANDRTLALLMQAAQAGDSVAYARLLHTALPIVRNACAAHADSSELPT